MASDQQFCLRWNNHQSTLVSVFDNLLESQTLVDCTLAADGQYLKAHKVVLSACSPYLEAILCQNLDKHPILILKDVKFTELKAMLDYMYRGEVNISQEQLSTFLKAAESLQIKGLTDSGGGGGGGERDLLKRQDIRKPLNQPVPHIPQPRPVVPHPGLLEPRRSLPHFPPHISDMQPQSPRHAREGSTSPTARKRRRPNRPSSDDSNFVSTPNSLSENQPDTSDSCDVPVKQSVPSTPSNVPNQSTKAPETDSPRTTPQPQHNSDPKQVVVKKEFPDSLLTPKTEFEYGNDNSMEDVTYEDDEDEEVDLSKPGTSFATNSQGFPPWQMGGDASNDDSNNIYSPDVSAASTQNNSQGFIRRINRGASLQRFDSKPSDKKRGNILQEKQTCFKNKNTVNLEWKELQNSKKTQQCSKTETILSRNGRVLGNYFKNKRVLCIKCNELVHKKSMKIHSKYYCGVRHDEKEWKLCGGLAFCKKCNRTQEPDSIEFHVGYLCHKRQIHVQCFYCPRIFNDYRGLLKHTNYAHHKKHRFQDLISILPPAESLFSLQGPVKIVKNFFSNYLNTTEEANSKINSSENVCMQVRKKSTHKCRSCGKILLGTHAYEDHINTHCDSENQYVCFYCQFKAEYPYQVLDHMEVGHSKKFNTFDLIQAKLTGIIPTMDTSSTELVPEDNEVEFANQQLFEPYIQETPIFGNWINSTKIEQDMICNKRKISGGDDIENTHNNFHDSSEHVLVNKKPETGPSLNLTESKDQNSVEMVKENGVHKIEFMRKISLRVSKKKVKIGNKSFVGKISKRKSISKLRCSNCQDLVIPGDMRIHLKYHCGTKVTNDWILRSGKALCLRCKKVQSSSTIDFHVKYLCERKVFSVQCFYCPKVATSYKSLLVHMIKGHNKVHYYQDLMTILPEAESAVRNQHNSVDNTCDKKVVKHPFIYVPPTDSSKSDPTCSKFPSVEDFYACFYCSYKSKAAFEALDHMEGTHTRSHNIYDLLKVKMVANYVKK